MVLPAPQVLEGPFLSLLASHPFWDFHDEKKGAVFGGYSVIKGIFLNG